MRHRACERDDGPGLDCRPAARDPSWQPKEEATMSDQAIGDTPPPAAAAAGADAVPDLPIVTDAGTGATAADAGMTDRAKGMLMQTAPWRRGVGWPVIAIEGLLGIGVGIYVIADPDGAKDVVRQFLGVALLINSLLRIFHGFRENAQGLPGNPYRLVTGGIGLTVGVIVLAEGFSDYIDADASRWVLAFGFLAFGLIGLAAAVATRQSGGLRRGPLITGVLCVAFAVLLFYNVRHNSLNVRVFGYVFLVFGALFLAYAYLLYRGAQSGDAAAAEAAV
jgi:uncharacterized membrane protein HdeD (DUF308 family)